MACPLAACGWISFGAAYCCVPLWRKTLCRPASPTLSHEFFPLPLLPDLRPCARSACAHFDSEHAQQRRRQTATPSTNDALSSGPCTADVPQVRVQPNTELTSHVTALGCCCCAIWRRILCGRPRSPPACTSVSSSQQFPAPSPYVPRMTRESIVLLKDIESPAKPGRLPSGATPAAVRRWLDERAQHRHHRQLQRQQLIRRQDLFGYTARRLHRRSGRLIECDAGMVDHDVEQLEEMLQQMQRKCTDI